MSVPSAPSTGLPLERNATRHLLLPVVANWWVPVALLGLYFVAMWVEGGKTILGVTWDPFWGRIAVLLGINLTLAISLQLINGIAGQFSLGHAGFMAVGAYLGGYAVNTYGSKPDDLGDPLFWVHPGGVLVYFASLISVALAVGLALFGVARGLRLLGKLHRWIPPAVAWALVAWIVVDLIAKGTAPDGPLGALTTLATLTAAVTGSFDWLLAHGTKVADLLTSYVPAGLQKPACFLFSLIGGGACAAIVGFVVGLPTLRLRGDYLAIATLGVAALIETGITNSAPFGRATGLSVPTYAVQAEGTTPATYIFPWVYGVALISFLIVYRIQRSPKGRALECLREDEIAAGAVGIDVTAHKVLAFVVGAALAGVAGALFAHYDGYLNPKQFTMQRSIELVVIVTLGGLGSLPGTIIACVILTLFQPALQTIESLFPAWVPKDVEGYKALVARNGADTATTLAFYLRRVFQLLAEYRLIVYALLLVVAMLARSLGWFELLKFWKRKPVTSAARSH